VKWTTLSGECTRSTVATFENAELILDWRILHDRKLREKRASEYIFFADETWFCIKSLLLGHITAIEIFCIQNGEKINPRSMNTDTVEWHFGNARQMVGRSTNKLTAAGFDNADKKPAPSTRQTWLSLVTILQE
jgi:hypothetical protein